MSARPTVAVLRTRPESVLQDYARLFESAGGPQALATGTTTILKDHISWHFPMPAANTTPWQLEGTILALRAAGFADPVCVQNQTVVTNAFKGEDLNGYVPVFQRYGVPALHNFRKQNQKLLFRTPLVVLPTFVGEAEQDYMHWPLKFKHVAEAWEAGTAWGQLFNQYRKVGSLAAIAA